MRPAGFFGVAYSRHTVLPASMLHLTNTFILHISWLHFLCVLNFFPNYLTASKMSEYTHVDLSAIVPRF